MDAGLQRTPSATLPLPFFVSSCSLNGSGQDLCKPLSQFRMFNSSPKTVQEPTKNMPDKVCWLLAAVVVGGGTRFTKYNFKNRGEDRKKKNGLVEELLSQEG